MCENTQTSGVDEQGMPYADYPKCPNPKCKKTNGVGRNCIGKTGDMMHDMYVDDWYCYCCCQTF